MEKHLLDEIIACLPKDRTLFRYARGDYALMLLSRVAGDGVPIGDIRQSAYSRLLGKPAVQRLLADVGDGVVSRSVFEYACVEGRRDFLVTVGSWNAHRRDFNQTSRHSGNLVLQLNFNVGHDREFRKVVGPSYREDFVCMAHPVLKEGQRSYFRNTMAWVRMDVEFVTDEVLIEEVQTDWLRNAKWYLRDLEWYAKYNRRYLKDMVVAGNVEAAADYVRKTLAPYYKLWDEAALTAAINFVVDELGIKRIYYHSFETGNVLKKIRYTKPPRSVYTDLPRKFCFRPTDVAPRMLSASKVAKRKLKKVKQPRWYQLEL